MFVRRYFVADRHVIAASMMVKMIGNGMTDSESSDYYRIEEDSTDTIQSHLLRRGHLPK